MKYLQRSFPFVKHKVDSIMLVSLAVSLLLYVFQPFNLNLYQGNKLLVSLGFGLMTFGGLLLFNCVVKERLVESFKRWTIWSEILYTVGLTLSIALLNYVYFSVAFMGFIFSVRTLLYVVYFTFCVALIPIVVLVLIKYNRYLKEEVSSLLGKKEENSDLDLIISNQLTREKDLHIQLKSFLFAEANKNNVEVYYLDGGKLSRISLRTTISTVQEELNHPELFRCHRSFIVNLSQIESAKGNSNGYQIRLKHYAKELPVSRKYVDDFRSHMI